MAALLATAQTGPEAVLGRPSFLWFGTCACASRGKARIFAGLNRCGSCPEAVCARFAAAANELPGATSSVLEDFRKRLLSRVPAKTSPLGRSKCKKINHIKTIVLKIEPDRSDARVASHLENQARSKSCPAHLFFGRITPVAGFLFGKKRKSPKICQPTSTTAPSLPPFSWCLVSFCLFSVGFGLFLVAF